MYTVTDFNDRIGHSLILTFTLYDAIFEEVQKYTGDAKIAEVMHNIAKTLHHKQLLNHTLLNIEVRKQMYHTLHTEFGLKELGLDPLTLRRELERQTK